MTRSEACESWPPANQTTLTGVPLAAMPAGVGVGLAEPEQRVLGALDQQRRRLDPVEHAGRAAAVEHGGDLRRERARGRGGLVGRADVGAEPAAGQRLLDRGRVERSGVEAGSPRRPAPSPAPSAAAAQGVEQARRWAPIPTPKKSPAHSRL